MSEAGRLSPDTHESAWRALERETFDVLVIGGGVVGAGTALDAASRGLSVALVEQDDWASGTSSRSSKFIHGGLRYLEMGDFRLVREALRERSLMLNVLAPHLVRPAPFLFPLTSAVWERAYVGAGIAMYDAMARSVRGSAAVPGHRHLSRTRALEQFPSLNGDAITGAVQYHDAIVDDARHTLTLVRTAVAHGAIALSRARVDAFEHDGERIAGARVVDRDNPPRQALVRARQVIGATGIWTDELRAMVESGATPSIRTSKGVHIVVDSDRIHGRTNLIARTPSSVLFITRWANRWILGTTDTDWRFDKNNPLATRGDIDYLLARANELLVEPLAHADISSVYCGLRPLLAGKQPSTAKVSREHVVLSPAPGLTLVTGGKYTTYRLMARDAVDVAFGDSVAASQTEHIPLLGAGYNDRVVDQRLFGRYGSLAGEVAELANVDPRLGDPLPGADGYVGAEVAYAVSHEGARSLSDVLVRRTRIAIEADDRGVRSAEPVAGIMAPRLGWDSVRTKTEVVAYRAWVEGSKRAEEQPDDETANRVT